jgi:hypothetical protein
VRKLRYKFEQWIEKPLQSAVGIATVITVFWGVKAIFQDVSNAFGSITAWFVGSTIVLLVLFPVVLRILFPRTKRVFHLPSSGRYIFTSYHRRWLISKNGRCKSITDRTHLFIEKPKEDDLRDTIFAHANVEFETLEYKTNDSTIIDVVRLTNDMLGIYWQPSNGAIEIGKPYRHIFEHITPTHVFGGRYDIHVLMAPVFISDFQIEIESEFPVERAVAYRKLFFQTHRRHLQIAKKGLSIVETKAPPPIVRNPHHVSWSIKEVPENAVFYLVLYYEGGVEGLK